MLGLVGIISFVLGLAAGILIIRSVNKDSEGAKREQINEIIKNLKSEFGSLSLEALSRSTNELLKLASSTLEKERELGGKDLDSKKQLIDQQLGSIGKELEKVAGLMTALEKDRENKFGKLSAEIESANKQTASLLQATNSLKDILANSRVRGQWGERMAEDVLRLAGFEEGLNYIKQTAIEGGSKPDFTFPIPKDLKLNMDVKFPLDNYVRYLESKTEIEREDFKSAFLKDVRDRLKEVTGKEYINPKQNTVDYVLFFVPNESIFAFIHQEDPAMLDNALKNKTIMCSPVTLLAVLATIRQAVDNFNLGKTTNEILSLLNDFKSQWGKFVAAMEKMGRRIDDAQKEYQNLISTRKKELERPLNKIESLRVQKGLDVIEGPELVLADDSSEDASEDIDSPFTKKQDLLR